MMVAPWRVFTAKPVQHPSGSEATKTKCGKEKCMANNNDNRVLGRRNARQLSAEELHKILGQGNTQMTQLPSIPFHPDF